MTLLAPNRLWLLIISVALVVGYAVLQRRRRHRAVRHPDLKLLSSVAPRFAGWRRHLTAAALLLGISTLILGLARPAQSSEVRRDDAVIVLAVDVSLSMAATDVKPNRLAAAVTAAEKFVSEAPDGYRIGVVAFDTSGHTLATPTADHDVAIQALERLKASTGTAAGEGLYTALDLLKADTAGTVIAADRPYQAVVLLADGANTTGRTLESAARTAADQGVPVFTIAFGTDAGVVEGKDGPMRVPADPKALAAVAERTDGADYTASSASQLADVYDRIGTRIDIVTEPVELTVALAAIAGALVTVALATSILWSPRLV